MLNVQTYGLGFRVLSRLLSGSGKKSANFLLRFEVYVGFRLHALVLTTVEPVICGRALFVSLAPKCWRWGSAFLRS